MRLLLLPIKLTACRGCHSTLQLRAEHRTKRSSFTSRRLLPKSLKHVLLAASFFRPGRLQAPPSTCCYSTRVLRHRTV